MGLRTGQQAGASSVACVVLEYSNRGAGRPSPRSPSLHQAGLAPLCCCLAPVGVGDQSSLLVRSICLTITGNSSG